LNTVVSNLQISLVQYKDEVRRLADANLKQLSPQIENAENLTSQINSLHLEIAKTKSGLEENVTKLNHNKL